MNFHFLRLPTLLFFLLVSLSLNAQKKNQVQWGKQNKISSKVSVDKIISQDDTGFYVLKIHEGNQQSHEGPKKVYIEHYNRKMNLTKAAELELKWNKKKRQFEDILMIGGELYLFTSFNNLAKRKNFLFAQKLNKKNLQAEKELTYIADIDTKGKLKEGIFDFHISADSSKLLIFNALPFKKNQPEEFAMRVYNNDLTLNWHKDISLPYNDQNFSIEDYQVDNNGNVYLLGVLFGDNRKSKRKGLPNYQYILLSYTNMGTEKEKYPIKLREKFITDLTFKSDNNSELVFSGFYSERGTFGIIGTYFFRINLETKEVFNKSFKKLGFDFRTEYVSERKKKKLKKNDKKAELYKFSLDELILRNDGGALLIAEQYYIEGRRAYSDYGILVPFGGPRTNMPIIYTYNYNDIIVVNINPNGEIEWASRIPKRQITENDDGQFSSYVMSITEDKINFMYNDSRINLVPNAKKPKTPYRFSGAKSEIALSQISPDGNVETRIIDKQTDFNILIQPRACKQIGPDEMVIHTITNKGSNFGKINL